MHPLLSNKKYRKFKKNLKPFFATVIAIVLIVAMVLPLAISLL